MNPNKIIRRSTVRYKEKMLQARILECSIID